MAGNPVAVWGELDRQLPAAERALPPVAPLVEPAQAEAAGRRGLHAVTVVHFAFAPQPTSCLANDRQVLAERDRAARAPTHATGRRHTDAPSAGPTRRHQPKRPAMAHSAMRPTSKRAGGHGR